MTPRNSSRAVWRWSWLATLPISIFFVVWGTATARTFWDFGVRYEAIDPPQLSQIGRLEFDRLLANAMLSISPPPENAANALRRVDLFVPEAELRQLGRRLPHSGMEYVEGQLAYPDGTVHAVSLRYRGDFEWHWANHKKSLRIKTRKNNLFDGLRRFNLIIPKRPELLNSYLGYRLAERLELITPRSEMVFLRINGEPMGVYTWVEQLSELTLRRSLRMPGDLYSGELMAKDAITGIGPQVFDHPGAWRKIAVNNHFPEDSRAPLQRLLELLAAEQNEATQRELIAMLDLDAWGRLSAFETLAQTIHFDDAHNWRLYYDPARSVFEPVVWDPIAWRWGPDPSEEVSLDIIPSRLHDALMRNHQFLDARQRALETFFSNGQDRAFLDEMESAIAATGLAAEADANAATGWSHLSPERARSAMNQLRETASRVFTEVRSAFVERQGSLSYAALPGTQTFRLQLDGRRSPRRLRVRTTDAIDEIRAASVRYGVAGEFFEADVIGATHLEDGEVVLEVPLSARFEIADWNGTGMRTKHLEVEPGHYEIQLELSPGTAAISAVSGEFADGVIQSATRVPTLEPIDFANAYSVVRAVPARAQQVWEDEVVISGRREVPGDLLIRAGTTVRMESDASLIVSGRLLAMGEADRPVRFIASGEDPWGALVLRGSGANGSRLQFCEIQGGSGAKDDLSEYSGMLSVHDVQDVVVHGCTLEGNRDADDMLHAVYSDLRVEDSLFRGAVSDAVDLDLSEALIDRCVFQSNGNDALDLMSTQAVVRDSILRGSGDKGISIGEGSHALILNSRIETNSIGVQVKDGSQAVLYNVDLIDNEKSLDAYKKNWRYGSGGRIRLYKGYVDRNAQAFSADKHSEIRVYDSFVAGKTRDSERISLDPSVDAVRTRSANVDAAEIHPDDENTPEFFRPYWDGIDPSRRGASGVSD